MRGIKETINIVPLASSLMESVRSIGYSFETAIADIIDNSISAKAKEIKIYLRYDDLDFKPTLQILDDGIGMDYEELINAMRLGSKNPTDIREKEDLGRFGLGLKSASFSQCKVLTLISKKDEKLNGLQWDLDLVKETNEFTVKVLSSEELSNYKNIKLLKDQDSGTLVQWENFDRISDSSLNIREEMTNLMNNTIEHLSLIFHRFLSGRLKISVNNEQINPKDPFLKGHSGTQELQDKKVIIDGETIRLYPYVLPHYSRLSAKDKRLSGKVSEQNKMQGFYLYRNERLIVWGDYLGLSRKSELGKNLRIQVDIPNNLDYLWEIDVKKSRASVPSKIKKNLLSSIQAGEQTSKRVNKFRGKKQIQKQGMPWNVYEDREQEFYFRVDKENELYKHLINSFNQSQLNLFKMYIDVLEQNLPYENIYAQIGQGKKHYIDSENTLSKFKELFYKVKEMDGINLTDWLDYIKHVEPYTSDQSTLDYIKEMEKFKWES